MMSGSSRSGRPDLVTNSCVAAIQLEFWNHSGLLKLLAWPAYLSATYLWGFGMRKAVAAITVGLLMVAGQAAAAGSNSAVSRIGDRVGAQAGDADELIGVPISVLLIGGAVLIATISVISDDGESD